MTAFTPYISMMGSTGAWTGSGDRATVGIRREAAGMYRRVSTRAWLGCLWDRLTGRSQHLPALADCAGQGQVIARHHGGNRTVPISSIRGSENRSHDFDRDFRPLNPDTAARWESVAGALLVGARLPAVDLIQVGDAYFVRDGHHRVSAARALGQRDIDATVTVWELAAAGQN